MKLFAGLFSVVVFLAGIGTSEGSMLKSDVDHRIDLSTAWSADELPLQVARHCRRGGGYYGPAHHVRRHGHGYYGHGGYGPAPRRRHHHHHGHHRSYYGPHAAPAYGSSFGLYIGF